MILMVTLSLMFLKSTFGCLSCNGRFTCKIFLSPSNSSIECENACFPKLFEIHAKETLYNITSYPSEFVLNYFFDQNYSFENEDLNLENKDLKDSLLELCANNTDSSVSIQNLINSSSITELEISNFKNSNIYTTDYYELSLLSIHDNVFESNISTHTLNFSSSIRQLIIVNNDFDYMSDGLFSDLYLLRKLDLSGNGLKSINRKHFENLKTLIILDLRNNLLGSFSSIPFDVFFDLHNLETLNLSDNSIGDIHVKLFSNLPNLKVLDLEGCTIEKIEKSLFKSNSKIFRIDLSDNYIRTLQKKTFENLPSLQYIDLSNNNLIRCYQFRQSVHLKIIDFSGNRIRELNKFYFKNITSLEIFNISHNLIDAFEMNTLMYLKNLTVLDASKNKINKIAFVANSSPVSLHIQKLDFSSNQISNFPLLKNFLYSSESLILDHNHLENIEFLRGASCNSEFLKSLKVSLRYNNITSLDVSSLVEEEIQCETNERSKQCLLKGKPKLILDISFNPFKCDSKLYSLYQYLKEKVRPKFYSFTNLENVTCHEPDFLKDNILNLLEDDVFVSPILKDCPEPCSCGTRAKDKRFFINCTRINAYSVEIKVHLAVTVLYFNQNFLRNLSSLNSGRWEYLTHLYLDDNDLGTLEGWNVPPKLQYLSIRGNNLKSLSRALMEYIPTQKNFDLFFGRNNRNCDCESKTLKNFITHHREFIKDIEDIVCDYEEEKKLMSSPLIYVSDSLLCAGEILSNFKQSLLISILMSCFVLLVLGIIFYFKQRYLIHSYMYIHCNKICCFKLDEKDSGDKIFDAFIAYNNSDDHIIMSLLKELEENEPYFRLCIHERNWLPGRYIYENIVDSVQKSKRTIILLSEDFISSPWFKVELATAISKEQTNRIIVILVNKTVRLDGVDKQFRHIISNKTYLVWGERWFWEKLRYAMPHKSCETVAVVTNLIE